MSFDVTPGFETIGSSTPDNLSAGDLPTATETVTIKSGAGLLLRGTLLGMCTRDTVAAAVAAGGNTGNGAPTAATLGSHAQAGEYTLRAIAAAANGGTFAVFAPDGSRLPDLAVGVAYVSDHISLTVADGAADFAVGDSFTIEVTGTGKYLKSVAAAVDGSQEPTAILLQTTDATEADKAAPIALSGEFNKRAVTFGAGHTAASVGEALKRRSIYLKDSVKA